MRNFEKNIKNKAYAFQLDPMPDSFDKVMDALEKKKKRRFIFWLWILIPGFLIAGGGLLINQMYSSANAQVQAQSLKASHLLTVLFKENKQGLVHEDKYALTETTHTTTPENKMNNRPTSETQSLASKNNQPVFIKESSNQSAEFNNRNEKSFVQIEEKTNMTQVPSREKWTPIIFSNPYFVTFPTHSSNPVYSRTQIPFTKSTLPVIKSNSHQTGRWSIGIYSDLGVSKNIFINNKDSAGFGYTNARQLTDKFLFSYSAGIQFRYSPVKWLAIETGIGFTHYESNQLLSNAGFSWTTSGNNNDPDTALTLSSVDPQSAFGPYEYQNVYDYISIPIKVYYQKKWNWTGIEAGGGIIFDLPVNTHSYVADENSNMSYLRHEVKTSRLNVFGIQASANIHLVFHIKKFGLFAGPTFKYRMNSMFDKNYITRQHNYFIGGEMGLRYHF